ncbi:MAG TPA: nucleotide exchange factor GrpE [Candidatus Angelobacter sp.]|nr:nucleotide exchange factor GrpE [Candidatus Angelobacter sp.]
MKIPIRRPGSKTEMSEHSGKTDIDEQPMQNIEQELPPADANDGFEESAAAAGTVQNDPRTEPAAGPRPVEDTQKLKAERDNLFDRLARLQAEFDNYRKRASKENADFRDFAVADAARSLLPVIDSFTLALKNAQANPEDFKKGVELIHKQLQEAVQKMGVQRIPAEGQPFDPRLHEAIEVVESNKVADNHVLEELQPGYKIKDRLLRPAMVRVAKNNTSVN